MSTLSNTLLQKVTTLVPLTATGPEVFVATMTTFLSDSYNYLEETLNHMSLLKGSEADHYVVQNLTWSGVYLMSTLSNTLIQKVLALVPLTMKLRDD